MADADLPTAGAAGEVRVRRTWPALRRVAGFHHFAGLHRVRQHGERSVLCPNVRVHSYGTIDHCILMPGVRVGRHARLRRAIVDRDVLIPRGAVIGYNLEEDRKRHTVTDQGVVVVTEDDEPLVEPIGEDGPPHRSRRRQPINGVRPSFYVFRKRHEGCGRRKFMSRKRRIIEPHAAYHVLNRAAKKAALFETGGDYHAFEKLLGEACERHPMRVLAYCLMPNHWHLLLWPEPTQDLTRFVQWLSTTHAARWNRAHKNLGGGAVYQSRFKSIPIQTGRIFYGSGAMWNETH
jgi:REP element-mobilizing transposase RayT